MARRRPPDQLDRLLDAAMRVFARKGLHEARMSDVAEEMGVSQGTVYNCVHSKEALFYLLLTRGAHNATPSQPELPVRAPSMKEILTRLEQGIAETFALPRLDAALAQRPPHDAGAELEGIVRELYERTAATRQAADVVEIGRASCRERV